MDALNSFRQASYRVGVVVTSDVVGHCDHRVVISFGANGANVVLDSGWHCDDYASVLS